jgi:hypothetical protein
MSDSENGGGNIVNISALAATKPRAVVFLASTDAAFITGRRLDVDGGQDLR